MVGTDDDVYFSAGGQAWETTKKASGLLRRPLSCQMGRARRQDVLVTSAFLAFMFKSSTPSEKAMAK